MSTGAIIATVVVVGLVSMTYLFGPSTTIIIILSAILLGLIWMFIYTVFEG